MSEERTILTTPESVSVGRRVCSSWCGRGEVCSCCICSILHRLGSLCSLLLALRVSKSQRLTSCSVSVVLRDRNTPAFRVWSPPLGGFERKETRCVQRGLVLVGGRVQCMFCGSCACVCPSFMVGLPFCVACCMHTHLSSGGGGGACVRYVSCFH